MAVRVLKITADIRGYQHLAYFCKILHNITGDGLSGHLTPQAKAPQRPTRNKGGFHHLSFVLAVSQLIILYQIPKQWNAVPAAIKNKNITPVIQSIIDILLTIPNR